MTKKIGIGYPEVKKKYAKKDARKEMRLRQIRLAQGGEDDLFLDCQFWGQKHRFKPKIEAFF
jgi:hypothetical protein